MKLDCSLIMKILERGNDVWIKRTKTGVAVLEAGFTKRLEIHKMAAETTDSQSIK